VATERSISETASDSSTRDAQWLERLEEQHAAYGETFNSVERARAAGQAHVVCLGDSHLSVFHKPRHPVNAAHLMPHVWFDSCTIVGATARGLTNPFSRTNALTIFRRRIELAQTWQQVVFQLGEVDCGFLIWQRAKKLGESVEEQFRQSVDNYVAFVEEIRSRGFAQLFVLSAPPPTTGDDHEWRGDTHPRRNIEISQRDRTDLTLRFNEELERMAGVYTFVDVTGPTMDPATSLVAPSFVNEDRTDHHLGPEPYGRLIAERLGPLLTPP